MPTAPHVIRLRGPWDWSTPGDPSLAGRISLPADWHAALPADYIGPVRFTRKFQRPGPFGGTLRESTKIWLVLANLPSAALITLNGVELPLDKTQSDPQRFDVTTVLQLRNTLSIGWDVDATRPAVMTEVWLEIVE